MSEKDNIKNYTADDIEKYHKGELSTAEMHAMEMAALNDPFLADAMEGYAASGLDIGSDISLLKKKLDDRISRRKRTVLPMRGEGSGWWKIAAMIILIAGVSLLVYQFASNKQSNETAILKKENRKVETPPPIIADSLRNNDSEFLNNVAVSEDKSQAGKKNRVKIPGKKNPEYNFGLTADTSRMNNDVAGTSQTVAAPVNKTEDKPSGEVPINRSLDKPGVVTLQKAKKK